MTGRREIAYTEDPNGTHTQYLVIYPTGAVTCDVHEMITRTVADAELPELHRSTGVMLIVNDDESPVWVNVTDFNQLGLEWEIIQAGVERVAEYVLYHDDERTEVETNDVFVAGFVDEPSYPQLESEPA